MSAYTQYLKGQAIQTGCDWKLKIKISSSALEVFPSDATFSAHIRATPEGFALAQLSTEEETITRVDGSTLEFWLKGDLTEEWKAGKVIMDAIRTDTTRPVHLGFELTIPVRRTITRL